MAKIVRPSPVALIALALLINSSKAATVYSFATLSSDTDVGNGYDQVSGAIATSAGTIYLDYSGGFSEETQINNMGSNFFTGYDSIYENSTVANLPARTDLISLDRTFSTGVGFYFYYPSGPVSVTNPILDLVNFRVSWTFPPYITPVILSQGFTDGGPAAPCTSCLVVSGNTLIGLRGSGVVELLGTSSTYNILQMGTYPGYNYDSGFIIGLPDPGAAPVSSVPEPLTLFSCVVTTLAFVMLAHRQSSESLPNRSIGQC